MARAPSVGERRGTTRRLIVVLAGLALVVASSVVGVLLYEALKPTRTAAPPRPPAAPPAPPPPAPPPAPTPMLVGVDDDTLKWTPDPLAVVGRQRSVGADAVRVWVPWHGETTPDETRRAELARTEQAAAHTRVVLAVSGFAADTPTTPSEQLRFCGFARAALALVPDAHDVVVWDEANSQRYWHGTPADYERLLALCYDALHALRPDVTVLDSTASAHAPDAFLTAVGDAYRRSGRTAPLVDAFGHNPYPRTSDEPPDATHAPGFIGEGDYPRLIAVLEAAFGGTPQSSLDVWYLEDGFQSSVPDGDLDRYDGVESVTPLSADEQASRLRAAILLAACQPHVRAFFNFELVDETRLAGWQSGLFWQGDRTKPAALAFADVAAEVRAGVRCPPVSRP